MFSFHTNAAPAILAENSFAAHTVEMPWDSTACQSLCLSIQSKSDLYSWIVESPWRPVKEHGLPKCTCLHDLAFCGMIKTSYSSPAFRIMKIDHFLHCGQKNFISIFVNCF